MPRNPTKHPAQYSPAIIDKVVEVLGDRRGLLLDPFAGPGKSLPRLVAPGRKVVGIEIERPWAGRSPLVEQGDATALRFRARSVSMIVTSPCYGNRFSDHHNASDNSLRRSYTHDIREQTGRMDYALHESNAGAMSWGGSQNFPADEYAYVHQRAWAECTRVAKPGAMFLLNVSDFMRLDARMHVSSWHLRELQRLGWEWTNAWLIDTPRLRHGENREQRVEGEWLFQLRKSE